MDVAWVGPGLVALRWWALLQVQVIWRRTVGPWWTPIAAGLAIVMAMGESGRVAVGVPADPWLAAGLELVLGGMIGLVVALPGHALVGAAQASARVLGTAPGPWRALTLSLVAATALGLDLHRPLWIAGRDLGALWPPGRPEVWVDALTRLSVARWAHTMALLALTLATPALLAAAVADAVIGVLGRGPGAVMPTAQGLAPWARVAAALVATGASWAAYDAVWAERALLEAVVAG